MEKPGAGAERRRSELLDRDGALCGHVPHAADNVRASLPWTAGMAPSGNLPLYQKPKAKAAAASRASEQ
jgi:hypothetical protein